MNDLVECAFNQYAKKTKCVAYCKLHHCFLTQTNIKNMNCLKKHCKHLDKLKHQFWIELERIDSERKQNKKNKKEYIKRIYENK